MTRKVLLRLAHIGASLALLALGFQTSAASVGCTGKVTFGEAGTRLVSSVPNRRIDVRCLNDLIVDTGLEGANYGSHEEFVAEVAMLGARLVKRRLIEVREYLDLVRAAARSDVGKTLRIRVIAFNDFHGNIDGTSLNLRSDTDNLFVTNPATGARSGVSAGDLIGASPLNSALFHDEPAIETMNRLGLEFDAVGNHEFDEGRTELVRMQNGGCHPTDANSCRGNQVGTEYPFEGARFDFLAANVVDSSSGKTLFRPYGIKSFKGNRIAFIGMTLKSTPSIVTPAGVAGLTFRDEADSVNALIGELKRRGVNAVVVLLHEGGLTNSSSINGCTGVSGPIVDIVSRLDDAVDPVVKGHTHQAYDCRLANGAGRAVSVTSAGSFGRLITRIDLKIDTRTAT